MLIKKVLKSTITVADPKDILSPDRPQMCMKYLTAMYVGKNYASCHIISVDRILKHSWMQSNHQFDGSFNIDVQFEVSCIIYIQGEIIHDCEVLDIDAKNTTIAKSKYASIIVPSIEIKTDKTSFKYVFQKGIVPIIVQEVKYRPNDTAVTVLGRACIPALFPNFVFKFDPPSTRDSPVLNHNLEYILSQISEEEKNVGKTESSRNFEKFFYKFQKETLFSDKNKGFSLKSIHNFDELEKKGGYICITDELPSSLTSGQFYYASRYDGPCLTMPFGNIKALIAYKYYVDLINLSGLSRSFPTKESFQSRSDLWSVYKMLKIAPSSQSSDAAAE